MISEYLLQDLKNDLAYYLGQSRAKYSVGESVVCVYVKKDVTGWREEDLPTAKRVWENQFRETSVYIKSATMFLYKTDVIGTYDSLYILEIKEAYLQ